ncbi:MAG: UDP-N-acetylglucosamine--N-acetylmuramyl-(pentapeptide) pyrophosphoryl-undecaprenol N-acetylglucosamine transferase [Candidatus Omnitrophica bacterium]|nr:UDP-N-acetylglucosamine--N-acetylmuramyl-(pentapeptide) pyrophosphoryl-undecaprenol N-acetylglucosamine transferase [Candidatus Omnitrophota bacterium]
MRVLLACDRSGGHIFPALALAKRMAARKDNPAQIYFFATSPFLKEYLKGEGFEVLGKAFPFRNLLLESFFRIFEALYLIANVRPRTTIGFGGRDSFFLIVFSAFFFRRTIIYEPNIKPGKANRILAFLAHKILTGFAEGFSSRKKCVVGIPLRENIRVLEKKEACRALGLSGNEPVVLCFGGSQGSSFLNTIMTGFVRQVRGNYQVIHLTGKREYFQIMQFYNTIEKGKFVRDFFYSMETLYSAADVVVSRCGASTLGEIAYYRKPAILIPHPEGGGHQKANALYFKSRAAAYVFLQEGFSFEEFNKALSGLLFDENKRKLLAENIEKINLGVSVEAFYNNICF